MLGALGILLLLNGSMWLESRRSQSSVTEKLNKIETQMTQLATRIDTMARSAPARGPDPNRVYTVKTDGAPAKGPAAAPVTIVEFSDFQ